MPAGREFTWTEIHQGRRVVIISENFAREYWGSAHAAIGKQIRSNPNDPWSEIVGVAAKLRHDGADKNAPTSVYWATAVAEFDAVLDSQLSRRNGQSPDRSS